MHSTSGSHEPPERSVGARPRPAPQAVFRGLREGGVLLHLETGAYHGINATGVAIWRLLDGERTVPDVAAELRRQVTDAPEDLERQVREFVDGLCARGLVSG